VAGRAQRTIRLRDGLVVDEKELVG
jgi:hypothetical protein